MVIDTYIIYESLEELSCYIIIIGGVGVPVSLRHIRSRKQDNTDGTSNIVLPCPGS
jgi:hypothetical protein